MLRGRPAGAQPALPPAPRGRLPSAARRWSGTTAAAKLPPRSHTRLTGSPAQRLLRRQQRRRPMRLGRRRPCRRWCRPDRERGEEKRAVFFPKVRGLGASQSGPQSASNCRAETRVKTPKIQGPGMSRNVSICFEFRAETRVKTPKIQDPGTSRNVSGFRPFFRLAF